MKTRLENLIHDVRNPLNAISVNAELAKLLLDHPGAGDQVKKALDTILQECRKCNDVLNSAPDYFPD